MSQLSDIAIQIKNTAQSTGQAQTTLPRGLTLTIRLTDRITNYHSPAIVAGRETWK